MKDDLIGIGRPAQGPTVDIFEYPTMKCDKCGNVTFKQAYIYKQVPGLVLGGGADDIMYPIPVFICCKCGELREDIRKKLESVDKKNEQKEQNTSLIL